MLIYIYLYIYIYIYEERRVYMDIHTYLLNQVVLKTIKAIEIKKCYLSIWLKVARSSISETACYTKFPLRLSSCDFLFVDLTSD